MKFVHRSLGAVDSKVIEQILGDADGAFDAKITRSSHISGVLHTCGPSTRQLSIKPKKNLTSSFV